MVAGSATIATLVECAAGRIEIAAGSGLRLENAASVARATKAASFHGSVRRRVNASRVSDQKGVFGEAAGIRHVVLAEDIRAIVDALHQG